MAGKISKIVTHGGSAHRDDFVAACVALALNPEAILVRREPSQEELDDPEVLVLDVGRRLEPAKNNFDHHQLPREHEPTCALSEFLKGSGIYEVAVTASSWLRFTEILDSKGPTAVKSAYGFTDDGFQATLSPVEAQLLRLFERSNPESGMINPLLSGLMIELGCNWLDYWRKFARRLEELFQDSCVRRVALGAAVLVVSIPADDDPILALDYYVKRVQTCVSDEIVGTIVYTERNGVISRSLCRRNDNPRVDMARIKEEPGVSFVHASGFLATVDGQFTDEECVALFAKATQ